MRTNTDETLPYVVVENAGYAGQKEQASFSTAQEAYRWIRKTYGYGSIDNEDLHLAVAKRLPNGTLTFDH